MKKAVCVCLSATIQKTIAFPSIEKGGVNRSSGYRLDASGKAVNAARVLSQLSPGSAVAVVPLGMDNAALFLSLAKDDSLPVSCVSVPGRTRYCYTLLENGGPASVGAAGSASTSVTELVVSEPSADADYGAIAESLLALVRTELDGADALLLAGSRPSYWPHDLCARIVREARSRGVPVLADFHGGDLGLVIRESPPEIIKINDHEFRATFGVGFPDDEETLAREIARRSGEFGNAIVVTRGSRDTLAAFRGVSYREGVDSVGAVNTIGCGDSFSAGFLRAWIDSDGDMRASLACGRRCATANALSVRPGSILDPSIPSEGFLR